MGKKTIQIADKPTEDEILDLLKNADSGLAALKGLLGNNADAETVSTIKALLENGTYGLNALKAALTGRANETTVAAVKALLENSTYGLNAIRSILANGTYGLSALKTTISSVDKYNNVSAGQLALVKTITRGNAASNTYLSEYSNPLSVNGSGEISIFGYVGATNTSSLTGSHSTSMAGITIDGVALPDSYTLRNGSKYSTASRGNVQEYRFKFNKSFSCKLLAEYMWSQTGVAASTVKFDERISYLLQTK